MNISTNDLKKLKELTGAGIMDCKKVLEETNGDMERSLAILNETASEKKRNDRKTDEGGVFIKSSGNRIALCRICCETDFVSRSGLFKENADKILDKMISSGNTDTASYDEFIRNIAVKTRENIELKTVDLIELVPNEVHSVYIHGDNRIGAVMIFETTNPGLKNDRSFIEFSNNICMHIAASNPQYISADDVPKSEIEERKTLFRKQVSDKPADIIENIIKGKTAKYLSEICLLEQRYVKDDSLTINRYAGSYAKAAGAEIKFKKFLRYEIGK